MDQLTEKHFAFPFCEDKSVLVIVIDNWFWFYDIYFQDVAAVTKETIEKAKPLFLIYHKNLDILKDAVSIENNLFSNLPKRNEEQIQLYFDPEDNEFKAETIEEGKTKIRLATNQESVIYCDIIASQNTSLEDLKERLFETYLGFIPSFQYKIETVYQSFFKPYKDTIDVKEQAFTSKVRNKEFERIFTTIILPFAKEFGFERRTKTAKRLVKEFENGVSVFITFDYYSFGYGSYGVSVLYFDKDSSAYEKDGEPFATLQSKFPYSSNLMIASHNRNILEHDVNYWIRAMQLYLFPYIDANSNHKSILKNIENRKIIEQKREELGISKLKQKPSYYFELTSSIIRNEKLLAILKEKAT